MGKLRNNHFFNKEFREVYWNSRGRLICKPRSIGSVIKISAEYLAFSEKKMYIFLIFGEGRISLPAVKARDSAIQAD